MSGSQSESKVTVRVNAADSLTEVFLVDSRFEKIAAGVGSVEAAVAPGLYKARFRVGQVQSDNLIEVPAGAPVKVFDGLAVQFSSPVPLSQTMMWQQEHGVAAQELSRSVPLKKGSGSQFFLFLRGMTEAACQPWLGVSLHDLDGTLLAEAEEGVCDAKSRCCGLHLELDPGTYRLRVEEEPDEIYEMFVLMLAGWQTQIFAVAEDGWLPGVQLVRAALPEAAVLMSEIGKGFNPASPAARQTEQLRLGLLHGRKVLCQTGLQNLLAAQPLNPMNVLYAAGLVQETDDAAELARHLDSILADLPDMQLLLPGTAKQFALPPLLRKSWQLLMDAVSKEKTGIPPGSLNEQIQQGAALNTALWLMHRLG
jgi:hypothetical protein